MNLQGNPDLNLLFASPEDRLHVGMTGSPYGRRAAFSVFPGGTTQALWVATTSLLPDFEVTLRSPPEHLQPLTRIALGQGFLEARIGVPELDRRFRVVTTLPRLASFLRPALARPRRGALRPPVPFAARARTGRLLGRWSRVALRAAQGGGAPSRTSSSSPARRSRGGVCPLAGPSCKLHRRYARRKRRRLMPRTPQPPRSEPTPPRADHAITSILAAELGLTLARRRGSEPALRHAGAEGTDRHDGLALRSARRAHVVHLG